MKNESRLIRIDSNMSIFNLVRLYPQVKEIMAEIGFHDILKPGMLQSAGRIMTIEKGAQMKKIDWTDIDKIFKEHGFYIIRRNDHE
jgi:hypothetical protein